jgi:putative RNA 2'-phosphotransferase
LNHLIFFQSWQRRQALGKRKTQIKVQSLGRLMAYILGYRPDEFGLVPDQEGFIPLKDLLKAVHEEPGWGYVRQSHINELFAGSSRDLFDWEEGKMRARERHWKVDLTPMSQGLPKILFLAVRRKAHAHALTRGLRPPPDRPIALSADRDMALRIGFRIDQKPVLLELRTAQALEEGVSFYPFEGLFLAGEIPASCISGPPLPKEVGPPGRSGKEKFPETRIRADVQEGAGTFILDAHRDPDPHRREKGKKRRGWKEDARKFRKQRGH